MSGSREIWQRQWYIIIYVRLTENKPGICLAAMKYGDERWICDSISRRWIRDSIARLG